MRLKIDVSKIKAALKWDGLNKEEKLFFVSGFGMLVFCFAFSAVSLRVLWHTMHPKVEVARVEGARSEDGEEGAQDEEKKSEGGKEGEEAKEGGEGSEVKIGEADKLPDDIAERQDGKMEEGHDLVDPEIQDTRGLASFMDKELKVDTGFKVVRIDKILTGTKGDESGHGLFFADLALELGTYEAQQEVQKRMTEIRSVIAGLMANRSASSLTSFRGQAELKEDIQRELNHILGQGTVVDVLLPNMAFQ